MEIILRFSYNYHKILKSENMDFFFVEYRDPIVGLIFLTILIFVVAVTNYVWRIFANKDKKQKLEKFIKKFEMHNTHKDLLRNENLSLNNLLFLANIFTKSGEFEKTAQIYLIALEKSKNKSEHEFIFLALAKMYFKAGFLERSKEVLLNTLKIRPRNKEALILLKIIDLRLKNYKDILDILDCLLELGLDITLEKEFIKALKIDTLNISDKEKEQRLLELDFKDNAMLKRWFFEKYHLFVKQELTNIIDLLFRSKEPLNLEDDEYEEFFCALKLSEEKKENFKNSNFKMLKILNDNGFKTKLDFFYMCKECKNIMPLFFYHCPLCYEFNSCQIFYEVKNDEKY